MGVNGVSASSGTRLTFFGRISSRPQMSQEAGRRCRTWAVYPPRHLCYAPGQLSSDDLAVLNTDRQPAKGCEE